MIVRWPIISGEPYQGVPRKGDSLLEKANFPAKAKEKRNMKKRVFFSKASHDV